MEYCLSSPESFKKKYSKTHNNMEIQEFRDRDREYMWLKSIEASYIKYIERIEKESDAFVVGSIKFYARGDAEEMELNNHRTIPYGFILEGLKAALEGVQEEIYNHEVWFKENNVQFPHDEKYSIPRYPFKG